MERGEQLRPEEIDQRYKESIESFLVDHEGNVFPGIGAEGVDLEKELENLDPTTWRLPVFVVTEGGACQRLRHPNTRQGVVWSTLYGYLALEDDLDTVRGVTFYDHAETAGLGAEIDQAWFQDNFVGKRIFDGNALRSIQVVKGKVGDVYSNAADHTYAVDGISGASMTGRGVRVIGLIDGTLIE